MVKLNLQCFRELAKPCFVLGHVFSGTVLCPVPFPTPKGSDTQCSMQPAQAIYGAMA